MNQIPESSAEDREMAYQGPENPTVGMNGLEVNPPWSVAGTTVDLVIDVDKRTMTVVIPLQSVWTIPSENIDELIAFGMTVVRRLKETLPKDWSVK